MQVVRPRQQRHDFNDVLVKEGEMAVKATLQPTIDKAVQEIRLNARKLTQTIHTTKQTARDEVDTSRGFCR